MVAITALPRTSLWLLGFALGGFADGILLHQVLQWHHLLSGVAQEVGGLELATQIIADGLFHALMYVLALAAMCGLWRGRATLAAAGTGRVLACALAGFALWHAVDMVVFHWMLGLHRIRMDAATPLAWDLGWFAVFGLLPAVGARWLLRRGGARGGGGRVAGALCAAALAGGWAAALPDAGSDEVLVLFAPQVTPAQALAALGRIDGRVVWAGAGGRLWAVRAAEPADTGGLRRRARGLHATGALLVSSAPVALGCLSWSRSGR